MNLNGLTAAFAQLGVTPREIYRSSFYLGFLQDTQTFFNVTMAGATNTPYGLGNNYDFVKPAVVSKKLLQQLADMLDDALLPALGSEIITVAGQNAGMTYQTYFTTQILNDNDDTWRARVAAFYTATPITGTLMQTIVNNFQKNIQLACTRVIADRQLLADFFSFGAPTAFILSSLKEIESSGSDFHNGGKQVLIFTFGTVSYDAQDSPLIADLKVVYKPSDIEVDCLVTGDTASIAHVNQNFGMAKSLVEIFNDLVDAQMQQDPNLRMQHLPTYKVLPRNYMSAQGAVLSQQLIGNAYGYIEYLNNDVRGETINFCGWYPYASSDYVIYSRKYSDQQAIIEPFYRMLGEWLALACTFSLTDMHIENVRVNKYKPVLIDLEISLASAVNDVTDTSLIGANGGITADDAASDIKWRTTLPLDPAGRSPFTYTQPQEKCENRLFGMNPAKTLVRVNNYWLVRGFNTAMQALQAGVAANAFNAWITRANNVLVRYVPFSTIILKGVRNQVYIDAEQDTNRYQKALMGVVQKQMQLALTLQYEAREGDLPNYIVLNLFTTQQQYMNYDVPIFYSRVGSAELYDYTGTAIPIPDQVTIFGPGNAPMAVQTNINRATFFNGNPFAAILANQVNVLGQGNAGQERIAAIRQTLFNGLGGIYRTPVNVDAFF